MYDQHHSPFDHLEAPEWASKDKREPADFTSKAPIHHETFIDQYEKRGYVESCKACRGTGYFKSYSGRTVGPCFKCKGKGKRTFATAPEARAKSRAKAAERREKEYRERSDSFEAWRETELGAFLWEAGKWSEFASDLCQARSKYGHLTERQQSAAERMMAKCQARRAEKEAEQEAKRTERPESSLDLSGLVSGMYAVPGGDTRLKVKIDVATKGKWAGWVFVKDGAEYGAGKRYGSQKPGEAYRGEIIEELRAIAADPKAASAAYGRLVGKCGVCGRKLEDEASVAAGIGPVCAQKF